jgi:hypothetical protein
MENKTHIFVVDDTRSGVSLLATGANKEELP